MVNVELLSKNILSSAAVLTSVIVTLAGGIALAIPTRSIVVDFAAVPSRVKRTSPLEHPILVSLFGFAITLARPIGFGNSHDAVAVKRSILNCLLDNLSLVRFALIIIEPLQRDCIRTVTSLYTKVIKPVPEFAVTNSEYMGDSLNAKPLYAVHIVEQGEDWFTKLLRHFLLPFASHKGIAARKATHLLVGAVRLDRKEIPANHAFLDDGHKRNLLSDGWHVCLGHAAPTGGIHNYIRLGANHQTQRVLSNSIIAQMEVCGNG